MDKIEQKRIWDEMVKKAQAEAKAKKYAPKLNSSYSSDPYKSDHITDFRINHLKPSQWINFGWFLITILFCWLVIPVFMWLWNVIVYSCWDYHLHERTITQRKGVFQKETIEVHYFRVKSIRVYEPFFYRLVGLADVYLVTSDPYISIFRIHAVHNGLQLREYIKNKVTFARQEMGVKETDFHDF